jgi:hypothetical protein
MNERKREEYAVIAASHLSRQDRAYALRMGILREPQWLTSRQNAPKNTGKDSISGNRYDLGDPEVMPAADIKSGWGMNVESRTGNKRRLR